jgi:putative ABC transport system permease protein
LTQTFLKLLPTDPGFDPGSAFFTQILLNEVRHPDDAARLGFAREMLANIEARPEIEGAAISTHIPFGWNVARVPYRLPGEGSAPDRENSRTVYRHGISPEYFRVMRIPLLRGRRFSAADRVGAPAVAMVNDAFAQRLGGNVLGRAIVIEDSLGTEVPREIVGVVASARSRGNSTAPREELYVPFEQQAAGSFFVIFRSASDLAALLPLLREQVHHLDPLLPLGRVYSYDELLQESVASQRFSATMVAVFSAQALLVAIVGLFGLVSYSLARRMPEFGVRLAVGADSRDLVRLLLGQGARLAAAGIGLGAIASLFAARLLESQLYELSPSDPRTLAAAAGLLGIVALAACYLPARRAARVDPIQALRHE